MTNSVLFVDDDEDFCELVSFMDLGADVCSDAHEALARLQNYKVLVTDISLHSTVSGLDLVRAFKRLHPAGVTVVVSGYRAPQDDDIDFSIMKPIELNAFSNAIGHAEELAKW